MKVKNTFNNVDATSDFIMDRIHEAVLPFVSSSGDIIITFVGKRPFKVELSFKPSTESLIKDARAIPSTLRRLERELTGTTGSTEKKKKDTIPDVELSQQYKNVIPFRQLTNAFPEKDSELSSKPLQDAESAGPDAIKLKETGTRELVVLAVKSKAIKVKELHSGRLLTFRPSKEAYLQVEGEILTVNVSKEWSYKNNSYVSGRIISERLDIDALKLIPLRVEPCGIWDPKDHYWGEPGEPIEKCLKPILKKGRRPQFEMERVLPGGHENGSDYDPIIEAYKLYDFGIKEDAYALLDKLLLADIRCIDAHGHLGNWVFNSTTDNYMAEKALRHFNVGCAIGELSLEKGFDGVLPWGLTDNRPYLRCLHGRGLCLWRLGQNAEALKVLKRMLWLNPEDNQGIRFLIEEIERGDAWEDSER